ncbi:MAG: CPBP family glutamic-type intramembrane protease [Planctomycetota bacterium]
MSRAQGVLWLEWTTIFVLWPFAAFLEVLDLRVWAFYAPPVVYAIAVDAVATRRSRRARERTDAELGADPTAALRPAGDGRVELVRAFATAALLACAVFVLAYAWDESRFLELPRTNPGRWFVILLAYPWISAGPQEFVYRHFYFRRYRRLFPSDQLFLAVNVALFAWLHLMYDHWLTIALTTIGGAVLTLEYERSKRLWVVWIVHAVLGLSVFTAGLGRYFYER